VAGVVTTPQPTHEGAPRRYTSAALTTGVVVAGSLFAVALILELLGQDPGSGEMTDIAAVFDGLVALTPWAWATAGAYAVVVTPVLGLLVTAWEYWSVGDRRTVLLAAAVIAVLAISAVVAVLR
jgi:uncharacterized membrane protein